MPKLVPQLVVPVKPLLVQRPKPGTVRKPKAIVRTDAIVVTVAKPGIAIATVKIANARIVVRRTLAVAKTNAIVVTVAKAEPAIAKIANVAIAARNSWKRPAIVKFGCVYV